MVPIAMLAGPMGLGEALQVSSLHFSHLESHADKLGVIANSTASTARNTPIPAPRAARRNYALRESTLDPQLDRMIKQEPKSRSTTPVVPFPMDHAAMSRQFAPPMHSWMGTPLIDSPMTQERSAIDSFYSTPTTDSLEDDLPRRTSTRSKGRNMSGSNQSLAVDEVPEFDDGQGEHTKLKGVVWDGMGLFDSATPDMRRKRNQKKAVSVVEQLQATSEVVEATECVFDAEGVLRRERPITGNPEEEDGMSPLKGESEPEPESPPPPKKKKAATRKPRAALAEKDVNTGRTTRRRRESHHPPFGNDDRKTPYFDGGADDDDALTYQRPRARPRTGLSIHRDNSGPDITFNNPAPMDMLNSAIHNNPFQTASRLQPRGQSSLPHRFSNGSHTRQPSMPIGSGFRPTHQNPLGLFQPQNFGSFGQFNVSSMFRNNNNHDSMPLPNSQQALNAFQNQFGGNNHFGGGNASRLLRPDSHAAQIPHSWDVFGFGQQDMDISTSVDSGFPTNGDISSVNPLFFSSNPGATEDDEATVSPPSVRGER